jgi:hypothetical protein
MWPIRVTICSSSCSLDEVLLDCARRAAGEAAHRVGGGAVGAGGEVGGHAQRVVDLEGGGATTAQRLRRQPRRHVDVAGAHRARDVLERHPGRTGQVERLVCGALVEQRGDGARGDVARVDHRDRRVAHRREQQPGLRRHRIEVLH